MSFNKLYFGNFASEFSQDVQKQLRIKNNEKETKASLLVAFKAIDSSTINLNKISDILVQHDVKLSQRDVLEMIRRHEQPEFKADYRDVIRDLTLNFVSEKWTVRNFSFLSPSKQIAYNEKNTHIIKDYGKTGYNSFQIQAHAERYQKFQKNLKIQKDKNMLQMALKKRLRAMMDEKARMYKEAAKYNVDFQTNMIIKDKMTRLNELRLQTLPVKKDIFENRETLSVRSKSVISQQIIDVKSHSRATSQIAFSTHSHYSNHGTQRLDFLKLSQNHKLQKVISLLKNNYVDDFKILQLWYESITKQNSLNFPTFMSIFEHSKIIMNMKDQEQFFDYLQNYNRNDQQLFESPEQLFQNFSQKPVQIQQLSRLIEKIAKIYMEKSSQAEISEILYQNEQKNQTEKLKKSIHERIQILFKSNEEAFKFFDIMQNGMIKSHQFVFCVDFIHQENYKIAEILELFQLIDSKQDNQIDQVEYNQFFTNLVFNVKMEKIEIKSTVEDVKTDLKSQTVLKSTKPKKVLKILKTERAKSQLKSTIDHQEDDYRDLLNKIRSNNLVFQEVKSDKNISSNTQTNFNPLKVPSRLRQVSQLDVLSKTSSQMFPSIK